MTLSPHESRLKTLLAASLVLGVNVYVAHRLFFLNFSRRMDSIEAVYMGISRWATMHWGDLGWITWWYTGMPFYQVYQPGLHLTVAAFSMLFHQPIPRAYHFVTALEYALGPLLLFVLCWKATGSRPFALTASLIYSLISPVNFFVPLLAHDTGGYLNPRRLWVLVKYGEGPHTSALLFIPIAILFLHLAITDRRAWFFPLAVLSVACIVMANWPGAVGLSMALAGYCLSRIGQKPRIYWPTLLLTFPAAYLLVCPWIPLSTIISVRRNVNQGDSTILGSKHALYLVSVAIIVLLLHLLFRKTEANPWFRFFVYFALASGTVVLGNLWFGIDLLPQPWRFQLEFEMAVAGAAAYAAVAGYQRISARNVRYGVLAIAVAVGLIQLRHYVRFAHSQIGEIDVMRTIEYRMAKAFEAHEGTKRVFAPGNVSFWLNMFTDEPQVMGCCYHSSPTAEHGIAGFIIYSGMNAGDRDAYISIQWLKAYGAQAVGVTGAKSEEPFKPFVHPEKFNGVLPEVWRDGDDAIYEIPQRSQSLAHVVTAADIIARPPAHGLDIAPIEPFVRALDNPDLPLAEMTWAGPNHATVRANMTPGQLLSVQETYDPGWHAMVNGATRPIRGDALGMMVIDPRCDGPCVVELDYDPATQRLAAHIAQIAGLLIAAGWTFLLRRRAR